MQRGGGVSSHHGVAAMIRRFSQGACAWPRPVISCRSGRPDGGERVLEEEVKQQAGSARTWTGAAVCRRQVGVPPKI